VINRVRELRLARGWSQSDLAARLSVSRQSVNAVENGRYVPSLPLALRIGEVFATPVEAIFSLADEGG
jgi:putative transcriptional regulator